MIIDYDTKMIENVLGDFSIATGINIILLRDDLSTIYNSKNKDCSYCHAIKSSKAGRTACVCLDNAMAIKAKETGKTQTYVCHAGLIDVVIPIIYDDIIIGYVMFGQFKNKDNFEEIKRFLTGFSLNIEEMEKYYEEVPYYNNEQIQSISNIALMLAKYVLVEKMIKPSVNEVLESATDFINNNLSKPLSVDYITRNINVCKSVLYKNFHEYFNCTVSQYINRKRIEKSIDYLLTTDFSMEEVSQKVGFSSAAYYTANFRRIKGISPMKFKKMNRKNT